MQFCKVTSELVTFLRKYAKGRKIIDMGAGECQLRDAMKPGEVISVEIFPREGIDMSGVYVMDAELFPLDYDTMLPVFLRPCHGNWVHNICTDKIYKVASFLYIGLQKNLAKDLDLDSLDYRVTMIPRPYTGTEGEKIWQIVPRDCHTDDTLYTFLLLKAKYGEQMPCWYEKDLDHNDHLNNMSGGFTVLNGEDQILQEIQANNFEDLDWKDTILDDPSQDAGYLDRSGRFIGCSAYRHISCAKYRLNKTQDQLEKEGWVHIYGPPLDSGKQPADGSRTYICMRRLSAEQRNWLSKRGYVIEDWD